MTPPTRAAFMVTCLADMFFPEVGEAIVRLLRRLGVAVEFPRQRNDWLAKSSSRTRMLSTKQPLC